jgi:hypothetical protein
LNFSLFDAYSVTDDRSDESSLTTITSGSAAAFSEAAAFDTDFVNDEIDRPIDDVELHSSSATAATDDSDDDEDDDDDDDEDMDADAVAAVVGATATGTEAVGGAIALNSSSLTAQTWTGSVCFRINFECGGGRFAVGTSGASISDASLES